MKILLLIQNLNFDIIHNQTKSFLKAWKTQNSFLILNSSIKEPQTQKSYENQPIP